MRVLLTSRATLFSSPGGDTVQMVQTARALERLGVTADVRPTSSDLAAAAADYDLIHIFNVTRPADTLHLTRLGVPVVLSPIYVQYPRDGRLAGLSEARAEYVKALGRWIRNGERIQDRGYLRRGHLESVRALCSAADMVLPNSHSEMRRLERDHGCSGAYRVVPNAFDPQTFHAGVVPDPTYANAVVCLARIEPLKNQLGLIKALRGTAFPLFIVGSAAPNHRAYARECRAAAGAMVRFVPHVDQGQAARILAAARVHALPSRFETTGLSSLEAAAMGVRLVVTDAGDQPEYFAGWAQRCDPDDHRSIRLAVNRAFGSEEPSDFQALVRSRYTWGRAAEQTLAAYEAVLRRRSPAVPEERRRSGGHAAGLLGSHPLHRSQGVLGAGGKGRSSL